MKIIIFFINPISFEQIEIKKEIVGGKGKLLTENLKVVIASTMSLLFL